jgi:hypothetical protein
MFIKRLLLFFVHLWDDVWTSLGFEGVMDFLGNTLVNHSFKSFLIQLWVVSAVLISYEFTQTMETWVFSPFTSVILITVMVVLDTMLGAYVALRQGEDFNIAKFTRLAPILISHLLIMSFSFHMSKIDGFLFGWLPQAVFAFFSGRNLMSIVRNMVVMKWLRGDFLQYLIERVKPDLVDAMKPDADNKKEKNLSKTL